LLRGLRAHGGLASLLCGDTGINVILARPSCRAELALEREKEINNGP
jgi:hypothetical protein